MIFSIKKMKYTTSVLSSIPFSPFSFISLLCETKCNIPCQTIHFSNSPKANAIRYGILMKVVRNCVFDP